MIWGSAMDPGELSRSLATLQHRSLGSVPVVAQKIWKNTAGVAPRPIELAVVDRHMGIARRQGIDGDEGQQPAARRLDRDLDRVMGVAAVDHRQGILELPAKIAGNTRRGLG